MSETSKTFTADDARMIGTEIGIDWATSRRALLTLLLALGCAGGPARADTAGADRRGRTSCDRGDENDDRPITSDNLRRRLLSASTPELRKAMPRAVGDTARRVR